MPVISTNDRNLDKKHISDYVPCGGGRIVHRYAILGTPFLDYEVLEPCSTLANGAHTHSTITTIHGEWYGDMTTVQLPASLDALPAYSRLRGDQVSLFYVGLTLQALALIVSVFPEDFERENVERRIATIVNGK